MQNAGTLSAARPAPEALRLLDFLRPLLDSGRRQLGDAARALAGRPLPFDPDTVEPLLFAGLARQLLGLLTRTLVLELNIARLQGLLHGDTRQERFASFVDHLSRPETAAALLAEYPVLAQKLKRRTDCWVAAGTLLLTHLQADWPLIHKLLLGSDDAGSLVEVAGGAGDSHRGGRSVLVLRFASGRRLVYKPRSLAIDMHFQELLAWANERGACPAYRTLAVIDRGDHGWVEHVAAHECKTAAQVQRFYERLGGTVALAHALAGSDLHYENVVAAGEHPILVDLEVLFHPHPPGSAAWEPAEQALADSILATGLLPRVEYAEGGTEGADISGLGAASGQLSQAEEYCLVGEGTDEMRVVRRRVQLAPGRHRPTLAGTQVDPLDYDMELAAGFTSTYRLLLAHRADLLAAGGLLERCAGDEVRYVARPTHTYALLLQEAGHPDCLRDPREQERLLDRLQAGVAHHPALVRLLPHERAALADGDVPLFTSRPNSLDLWSSSGERMPDFFEGTGLDRVRRRLEAMDEADLERQLFALRAALALLPTAAGQGRRYLSRAGKGAAPGRDELLDAARTVGDRLGALAWHAGGQVGWLGLKPAQQGRWALAPVGADLYDGLPGIALFLAHLGACTGEARSTALARAALAALRRRLSQRDHPLQSIGAFEGWGGVIYALTQLAVLWHEPALLAEAGASVDAVDVLLGRDEVYGVIGGAAGAVLCLLGLYRHFPSAHVLSVARRCGEHLLGRAVSHGVALAWKTPVPASAPLTGLSHGTAGMAWALTELAAATGEPRFRSAALGALRYERSLFDVVQGNWPDFRLHAHSSWQSGFPVAWCHGAAGVALSRLGLLPHLDDPQLHAEIRAAVKTTCARGFGNNHSLCHGDLGNAEVVLTAGRSLAEPGWIELARRRVAGVLESKRTGGWVCATPRGTESPGLMTGLAGIGYAFLRMAEPERVPSVLTLSVLPARPAAI